MKMEGKPIDFALNKRTDSNEITDKLCSEADYLFKRLLATDYVQKLLVNGETTEENLMRARRRVKDLIDWLNVFADIFEFIAENSDDSEEKTFFREFWTDMQKNLPTYVAECEATFGRSPTGPISMALYIDVMYHYYNTSKSYLRGVVCLYATIEVVVRVLDYVRQNPRFNKNPFASKLCFEDFGLSTVVEKLREIIDKRKKAVSEEEMLVLIDIFKRGFVKEIFYDKSHYEIDDPYYICG